MKKRLVLAAALMGAAALAQTLPAAADRDTPVRRLSWLFTPGQRRR